MRWAKEADGIWASGDYVIFEDGGSADYILLVDPRDDGDVQTRDFDSPGSRKALPGVTAGPSSRSWRRK